MFKKITFSILLFVACASFAQTPELSISFDENTIRGRNVVGYYQQVCNCIVLSTQDGDKITHFFYDSAFQPLKQYKVNGEDRRLLHAIFGPGRKLPWLIKSFSLNKALFEVYASRDSIILYELDIHSGKDRKVTGLDLSKRFKDEELVAVMPDSTGCSFLSVSLKEKQVMHYRWMPGLSEVTQKDIRLPESTLSKAETKQWKGDFLELPYKTVFFDLSVSTHLSAEPFHFPSQSQLFYNESHIRIVNRLPLNMGINVLTFYMDSARARSDNYIVNDLPSNTNLRDLAAPIGAIYDSLLIINNWSENKLEYYFFNLFTQELVRKHATPNGESIYSLVHSPLRQLGTFGSAKTEKQLENEKRFVKRMGKGLLFMKPAAQGDSLTLTFGSFVPTEGVEGLMLGVASAAAGAGVGQITGSYAFFYQSVQRSKFLFAHSRFSIPDLAPSTSREVKTFLDAFVADRMMEEIKDDNSILIPTFDALLIGTYNRKNRKLTFKKFSQ